MSLPPDAAMSPDVDRQPDELEEVAAGEWLDLTDACRRLSVSERTLFRRIAAGQLQKRTNDRGRVEVWVPTASGRPPSGDTGRQDRQTEQIERGLAVVDRFNLAVRAQVEPLLLMLDERDRTIRDQAEELGKLRQQVADLERRLSTPDTDSQQPRPWWAFWRG